MTHPLALNSSLINQCLTSRSGSCDPGSDERLRRHSPHPTFHHPLTTNHPQLPLTVRFLRVIDGGVAIQHNTNYSLHLRLHIYNYNIIIHCTEWSLRGRGKFLPLPNFATLQIQAPLTGASITASQGTQKSIVC